MKDEEARSSLDLVEHLAAQAAAQLRQEAKAVLPGAANLPPEAVLALTEALDDYARAHLGVAGLAWQWDGQRLLARPR